MTKANLGIIFHPSFSPALLPQYAQRAERAGFDELWLWDDSFLPGALTAAAIALASTERLRVGIGIMPFIALNPLFFAMEITTLALAYADRFVPGFGHGVDVWIKQIGAAPKSSLKALEEVVVTVRRLLMGEQVTFHGEQVRFDQVQMQTTPASVPPLLIGAMREKTAQLAGKVADGTILSEMSSPAYVRWMKGHLESAGARANHQIVVYGHSRVSPDGAEARRKVRQSIAETLVWAAPHLKAYGVADEAAALVAEFGAAGAAERFPEAWLDHLSISGTPEQAAAAIHRLAEAGATSVVLRPAPHQPECLDEYIQYLMPILRG